MKDIILKGKKVAVISLGCDKNRVDTEKMLGSFGNLFTITSDPAQAEIIIINSCAFIEAARKESIETVLEFNEYKKSGKLEKLVVTGCLPQKFSQEIFSELTEADVLLGVRDYSLLPMALTESYERGERVNYVGRGTDDFAKRVITTPLHYAYLKIADGCNNRCAYCLIPYIRGNYKSESIERLISEAEALGELSELILVAQDITRYGIDIYKKPMLTRLIRELSRLENIKKLRLLYCYPDMIDDELIAEIRDNDKIIKYIDIPLQHSDEQILKAMNRRGSGRQYLALINKLKAQIPSIAIRSTFIAGFPGETEENFENLKAFLKEARLFNAGFFAYSAEKGTPAYSFKNPVPQKIKAQRVKELYAVQRVISKQNLSAYKGKILDVTFDEIDYDRQRFIGRAYFSAPEIDGKVYFTSNESVEQGKNYKVKITSVNNYDLYGRLMNESAE